MVDFENLELDRPDSGLPPPQRTFPLWAILGIVVLLIAAGVWYFYFRTQPAERVDVRTDTEQPVKAPERLPGEPGDDIPLPPLDETDPIVRELVTALSSHPTVAAWLTTDHLIRNFTVVVTNIANGRTPSVHLQKIRPTGPFQSREAGGRTVVDPRSHERYNRHADAVAGIDARGAARLYATLKPRIDDAYSELGTPGDFDDVLERAIVHLLQTPVVEGDVALVSDSVAYTYADPALERLSHAQRQLLRMGPRNQRIVQSKLREIAGHLGIPPESLPPETSRD